VAVFSMSKLLFYFSKHYLSFICRR
jgi:hypothetical protein